jgi:imidazole glycerol-phosphate synthase subunit HisH
MSQSSSIRAAIVDYGLGNLFSVLRACQHVGIEAATVTRPQEIEGAEAIILPGVGAFGDAMATLRRLELVEPLREAAAKGTPMMGICLGFQLFMSESSEFGQHEGLSLLPGKVVRLEHPMEEGRALKVPEICWNRIWRPRLSAEPNDLATDAWAHSPLNVIKEGEFMYFVHSYVVQPTDVTSVASTTRYGQVEFCSSVSTGNLFGCQFHPERSGAEGLRVYASFARWAQEHQRESRKEG